MAETPSKIKTFLKCPLLYNTKVPYKQHPNAVRGDKVHLAMESIVLGQDTPYPDVPVPVDAMEREGSTVHRLIDHGWVPQVELELATDGYGNNVPYNDPNAWLRGRIDLMLTHPHRDYGIIIDWKTGKIYDEDLIQLECNAIFAAPYTGLQTFYTMFVYLDLNKVKWMKVFVDAPRPRELTRVQAALSHTPKTLVAMHDIATVRETGNWIATPNNFCRWRDKTTGEIMGCEVKGCGYGKYGTLRR